MQAEVPTMSQGKTEHMVCTLLHRAWGRASTILGLLFSDAGWGPPFGFLISTQHLDVRLSLTLRLSSNREGRKNSESVGWFLSQLVHTQISLNMRRWACHLPQRDWTCSMDTGVLPKPVTNPPTAIKIKDGYETYFNILSPASRNWGWPFPQTSHFKM